MVEELPCMRNASRAAASALKKAFDANPMLRKRTHLIPAGCPLDVESDMYAAQEKQRTYRVDGLWRCAYCAKTFVSEGYLDRHMDHRHAEELPKTGAPCLGHLCRFLPCQRFGGPPSDVMPLSSDGGGACTDDRADAARDACLQAIRGCFHPEGGPRAAATHDYLRHQLCDHLHCDPSKVPSHADFHFTWRSPHPYHAGEAGQLSGTAAFFTVLLVVAIMGVRHYIRANTIPPPDLRPSSRRAHRKPWPPLSAWTSNRGSSSKPKLG